MLLEGTQHMGIQYGHGLCTLVIDINSAQNWNHSKAIINDL